MMSYQFTCLACAPNRAVCKLLVRYTNVFDGEREKERGIFTHLLFVTKIRLNVFYEINPLYSVFQGCILTK